MSAKQTLEQITKELGMTNPSFDGRLKGGLASLYKLVPEIEGTPDYTPEIGEKIKSALIDMRDEAKQGSTWGVSHEKEFNDFVKSGFSDNFAKKTSAAIQQKLVENKIGIFPNSLGVARTLADPDRIINALNAYDEEVGITFNKNKPEVAKVEAEQVLDASNIKNDKNANKIKEADQPVISKPKIAENSDEVKANSTSSQNVDEYGNPVAEPQQSGANSQYLGYVVGALESLNSMEGFEGFGGFIAMLLEKLVPELSGLTNAFNDAAYSAEAKPGLTEEQRKELSIKEPFDAAHGAVDMAGSALGFAPEKVQSFVDDVGHKTVNQLFEQNANDLNGQELENSTQLEAVQMPSGTKHEGIQAVPMPSGTKHEGIQAVPMPTG